MAIAPLQPHRSWYRHFWYAERSPRDTLVDRSLLFAIAALSLIAGGLVMARDQAATIGAERLAGSEARALAPR